MIEKFFTLENVEINVKANDWIDAITKGGNILLKNNKIEEIYIESMINTIKELGPYIVMVKGIAMPHSRPEFGVKSLGLSVITLVEPINFGNVELDPVSILFTICSPDNNTHLNLLQDLSYIMEDTDLIIKSKKCKNKQELIDLLKYFYNKNK